MAMGTTKQGPRPAWRRGQILIPSLLVIPSLLLFVYLLFETTKISREKIRQQFAVDSAAFIQMVDYTNLLNRTAYVNGAFPYRIFKEAYECPGPDGDNEKIKKADGSGEVCGYDMLYEAGAIPKYSGDVKGGNPTPLDNVDRWSIAFDETARPEFKTNPTSAETKSLLYIITKKQGEETMIAFKTTAAGYYKFYAQVYALLGSVEDSQYTVFERLVENFNFFRKSYYLNANTQECVDNPMACGEQGLSTSGGFMSHRLNRDTKFLFHYVLKVNFWGRYETGNPFDPIGLGQGDPPMDMTSCPSCNPKGLFQLATVDSQELAKLGNPGLDVYQGWNAPSNYFNIDFNKLAKCSETQKPCVHALIATQCPNLQGNWPNSGINNCVWPNPTPKYQTRLYP